MGGSGVRASVAFVIALASLSAPASAQVQTPDACPALDRAGIPSALSCRIVATDVGVTTRADVTFDYLRSSNRCFVGWDATVTAVNPTLGFTYTWSVGVVGGPPGTYDAGLQEAFSGTRTHRLATPTILSPGQAITIRAAIQNDGLGTDGAQADVAFTC